MRYMKKIIALQLLLLLFAGCKKSAKDYDATGVFEATETTVYAEQNGVLLSFNVEEGSQLAAGQEVGLIDTTQIWLQLKQLETTKQVYSSQKPDTQKQIAALREQLAKARREQQRYSELVRDGAAPSKTLDDAKANVQVLQRQLDAQLSTLDNQNATLNNQIAATSVQVSQLSDQLRKCHIAAPMAGTVLEKYVERGEFVTASKPLFKLADTQNMYIRAYLTSAQLKDVRIGQQVKVFADYGKGAKTEYPGTVSWISGKSEFTPKTIVTDDERADLVYAVKILVQNDGNIKIGMYGEVKL